MCFLVPVALVPVPYWIFLWYKTPVEGEAIEMEPVERDPREPIEVEPVDVDPVEGEPVESFSEVGYLINFNFKGPSIKDVGNLERGSIK